VVCNQKYADTLPYSTHLGFVEAQGEKFIYLFKNAPRVVNPHNYRSVSVGVDTILRLALISHDVIEDARLTYNDLLELVNTEDLGNTIAAQKVVDIVYCVTDEKGKTRKDRKNDKYYSELKENKLAVFVKLADLAANTLFSKLSGSSMYKKYKKEFPSFKEKVYIEELKEMFDYVENL
jgi:hypothetical protein